MSSSGLKLYPKTKTSAPQTHVFLVDSHLELPTSLPEPAASLLAGLVRDSGFKGAAGDTLPLYNVDPEHEKVLLVGLGSEPLRPKQIQTVATNLYKALNGKVESAALYLDRINHQDLDPLLLALLNAGYSYDTFKSKKAEQTLKSLYIQSSIANIADRIAFVSAISDGQSHARELGNLPANICFPEFVAEQALDLAQTFPELLKVTVLDEAQMAGLGMNSFLAVSKGSDRPGRLVTIEYTGRPDAGNPVVLVGKGVTFDTGGISIKPAAGMEEMIYDMSGAGTVLGVMRALCQARLPINVVGTLALAENMPSGKATRPGDVVTSMAGTTIEILNTDAEGRLVLCDALTYIERFKPSVVIDIATLTGACVVALGKVVAGLFANDDALASDLYQAGQTIQDRVWRMPLLEDYQELLDSPMADVGNIGGPTAGAITAACFLSRFARSYRWAHLDIAGVSNLSGPQKGSTGRPVPLLMQYLKNQVEASH